MKKFILGLSPLLVAGTLCAQNNPAVQQADSTRLQRATDQSLGELRPGEAMPALYDGETEDVGPQSVLRQKKTPWFRAVADGQVFYTDNFLYLDSDKEAAGAAVTTVEAAFMTKPCITRFASYRAEVGYRHQFYNYFGNDSALEVPAGFGQPPKIYDAEDFDFDSSTAFLNLSAQTRNYQFTIGVDYTRLLGFEPLREDDYDEFYSEVVPRWAVQRNFRVCDRSMVSLAYLGSYHFTDEAQPLIFAPTFLDVPQLPDDRSERWEHTFLAAYTVALPHDFALQPYYRFQLNDFVHTGNYLIHTVGLSAGWYPWENFSVRGFVGYNWSDAEDSAAVEYEKLDAGAGFTATLRF